MMSADLRGILVKTWAGPFEAGPLVHPVSVGDTLLKLLQTLWRAGLIIVAGVLLLILYVWLDAQMQPPPLGSQISSSARVDRKTCGAEKPLLVSFTNGSKRTVQEISFNWVAHEAGRSGNLATGPRYLRSDVIIPPGRTADLCWTMPELDETHSSGVISYGVDISYASDTAPL